MGKTRIVRLLRNGQITIPKEFREALHLAPDDLVGVTLEDGRLDIKRVTATPSTKGSAWFKELYDLFEPARSAIASSGLTDEEINAEIDTAIREVRAKRRKRTA
ncbi:MAG: AbrB/MazE/SpoVT family DNA-binding domain-containing protein [Chloroflexota bacterium]|nr:AbrB/MazE/SpoVT family DNA-binding domain-containing protein [Chloroflexota bacterium]